MAFLVKNVARGRTASSSPSGTSTLDQFIQVTRAGKLLPATTTQQLFRVKGGRVLVQLLYGTATVILDATDPVAKISSKALSTASVAVGTAVDVASTVNLASLEVGGYAFVEGDGTALVKSNAGAAFIGANSGRWIAPQGEIYLTTGGTNLTGFMQWDIFYVPLDAGAYVESVDVATAAI